MTLQQKPDDFKSQFKSGCPPCTLRKNSRQSGLAVNLVWRLIEFESSITKPNLVKPYTVRCSAEDEIRAKSGLGWLERDFQLARSNKAAAPCPPPMHMVTTP
jgi:hypothetical protein